METFLRFLFNLKSVSGSDLGRMHFTFAVESLWWAIPLLVVLAVFGYWSYQRQSASPAKRVVLGLLRAAALVLVLVLFLRPSLVLDKEIKTPSVVAVWVDDSNSMSLQDPYKDPAMRKLVQEVTELKAGAKGAAAGSQPTSGPASIAGRASRFDLAVDVMMGRPGADGKNDNWLRKLAGAQDVAVFTGGTGRGPVEQVGGIAHDPEGVGRVVGQLAGRQPAG